MLKTSSGTNKPRNADASKASRPRVRSFLNKRLKPGCGRLCELLVSQRYLYLGDRHETFHPATTNPQTQTWKTTRTPTKMTTLLTGSTTRRTMASRANRSSNLTWRTSPALSVSTKAKPTPVTAHSTNLGTETDRVYYGHRMNSTYYHPFLADQLEARGPPRYELGYERPASSRGRVEC
jgi:hypothetical protein